MATSLKAQEVLDSLIGILQAQADQLPPIHARLGLPHEALEEDLDQLKQQLEITITKLVERRRIEVNELERRCHAVERDCSALGKCLGGGIGVDEKFLSLVHNEPVCHFSQLLIPQRLTWFYQVLPTRHTMILELQQELQKVYHHFVYFMPYSLLICKLLLHINRPTSLA
jgi:protein regulator of cytokinesis 1